jgi:hypothetical protein
MTNSADFNDGYSVGLTWSEDWRPGGPYVPSKSTKPQHIAIREAAVKAAKEWMQGFDAAQTKRLNNWLGEFVDAT